MQEKMLTLEQVANQLAMSRVTVWRMVKDGILPAIRIGKKLWRVKPADLERFLSCPAEEEATTSQLSDQATIDPHTAAPAPQTSFQDNIETVSVKEAASRLKISTDGITLAIRRGKLAATKVGKSYRISFTALEEYAAKTNKQLP